MLSHKEADCVLILLLFKPEIEELELFEVLKRSLFASIFACRPGGEKGESQLVLSATTLVMNFTQIISLIF
jgi:hypothetical protein